MGIAYKDLKAGKYYKGDAPNGVKMFLYIENIAPHQPPNVQVTSWEVKRTKGAPLGSARGSWTRSPNQVIPGTQDSFMRREVTTAEIQQEGFPLVTPVGPSSTPAPGSSPSTIRPSEVAAKPPTRSALPSKPPALRKDGTPKAVVEGNSKNVACLYCGKPNKPLVLFSGSTLWCPDCEP